LLFIGVQAVAACVQVPGVPPVAAERPNGKLQPPNRYCAALPKALKS
jgi:hypothetical protein